MWSDRYYYLYIYREEDLSSSWDTKELRDYINSIPELINVNTYEFKNAESFPFTQLLLLKAKSLDNWSWSDTSPQMTNLIAIVCSKGEQIDFKELRRVFIQIASFLNWKLVDEETDDGIENFTIWDPKNTTNARYGI